MAQHRSGKNQASGRRSGRNTGGAECFQHRLCVCTAAHHQHGRGRSAERFLGIAGAAGGHPAGADRVERGGPLFKRVHQRRRGKPLQAPALLRPAYRRLFRNSKKRSVQSTAVGILHRRSNVLELFSGFIDLSKCRIGSSRLVL